jgi:hypothetical protein
MSLAPPSIDEVKDLFSQLLGPPEGETVRTATTVDFTRFEQEVGIVITPDQQSWLSLVNGTVKGPGGLYGICLTGALDISCLLEINQNWLQKKWLPVAGDGCGNHYLQNADPGSPFFGFVFFVDSGEPDEIAYFVASTLWHFLRSLFCYDLGQERRWPFDPDHVLHIDPDLGRVPTEQLPWK